jgi:hypothetical protein
MTSYNSEFYKGLKTGSLRSAEALVPDIINLVNPKSVLDLGCGIGTWLSVFKARGVEKVYGFDGSYVDREQLLIKDSEFKSVDLSRSFPLPVAVDLALSLEVAEHLKAEQADQFVEFLTSCSDCVFFGAAIPLQGGTDHYNEQWQSYWSKKFQSRGYVGITYLRDLHWNNAQIEVWYRQNALLFVRRGSELHTRVSGLSSQPILDLVHPDLFALKMRRYHYIDKLIGVVNKIVFAVRSRLL